MFIGEFTKLSISQLSKKVDGVMKLSEVDG